MTMADHSKFAVFILTHGRPDRVITLDTLRKAGYTGRTYLVIDNEDETADEYRRRFGAENVIEFDKAAVAETFDTADTQQDRRTIVYARNACFGIARDLGLDYFLELDDDYGSFLYRSVEGGGAMMRSFDAVADAMLTFLDDSGAATVAMAQGGDFMGGVASSTIRLGLERKAMNSFFFCTGRRVAFVGRINEDVNTYIVQGSRGDLFLTVTALQLNQTQTQQESGGMTEAYLAAGTYVKSFYTVMMAPSCVKVRMMNRPDHRDNARLHHSTTWDHAVPKIISGKHRKATLAP